MQSVVVNHGLLRRPKYFPFYQGSLQEFRSQKFELTIKKRSNSQRIQEQQTLFPFTEHM